MFKLTLYCLSIIFQDLNLINCLGTHYFVLLNSTLGAPQAHDKRSTNFSCPVVQIEIFSLDLQCVLRHDKFIKAGITSVNYLLQIDLNFSENFSHLVRFSRSLNSFVGNIFTVFKKKIKLLLWFLRNAWKCKAKVVS